MNAMTLLFLTVTSTTLVLHSGDRFPVEGTIREENGVVTFRSGGTLYSLPAEEIAHIQAESSEPAPPPPAAAAPRTRMPVSEERRRALLQELERNHAGGVAAPVPVPKVEPLPDTRREEAEWRAEARAHEESIRQAQEDLQLLEERADALRQKIHSLVSIGYKPHQFTYDTTLLARTLEQIPHAELAVKRAERAYEQFRDEARRQGILPGWLR